MANLVVLELSEKQALLVCAKSTGNRHQLTSLASVPIEADEKDNAVAEKIKNVLGKSGVSRAELLAVVGRQDAEIRQVTVPPAPESELPDLVRFQAKNVFASLTEQWLLDFIPGDQLAGAPQRVLAVAIAPQVKKRLSKIAEIVGLKLKRIVFRPYVIGELLQDRLVDGKNRLLLFSAVDRLDMTVNSGTKVVTTRSVLVDWDRDLESISSQIVNEISRTISAARNELPEPGVQEICVVATRSGLAELKSAIHEKTQIPTVGFDPTIAPGLRVTVAERPEHIEHYAAAMGAAAAELSRRKPVIDFLNPRRPVVKKRDLRKPLFAAAVAVLLVLFGFGGSWYVLRQQNKKIVKLQEELNTELADNAGKGNRPGVDQIIGEVAELDEWQAIRANWLDEIAWVSEKMLTPDDIIIDKFRGTETADGFRIELNSRMTKAKSQDSSWKSVFAERYEEPDFGQSSEDLKNKDYPVTRPFSLVWKADVGNSVQKISAIANENRIKQLEGSSSEKPAEKSNKPGETSDGPAATNAADTTEG